jgi:hypothetical protein
LLNHRFVKEVVMSDDFKEAIVETVLDSFAQACAAADAAAGNNGSGRVLLIDQTNLPAAAEKLRDIFAGSGLVFERGSPVCIAEAADGTLGAVTLTNHGVVRLAHRLCISIGIIKSSGVNPCTLPERVAGLYLDMAGEWRLPKLVGISTSPLLAADGGIRAREGYDVDSGLYCRNVPQIRLPDRPSKEEATAALARLRHEFRTFPFADAVRKLDADLGVDIVDPESPIGLDESGFLVGLLTAVCRQSLWLCPGLLLNAPSISGAGAGKGLLARAIGIIAYGIRPRPFTPGNDRHEMDKRLVAELLEAAPIVFMDNVNGTLLRSNTLASLVTERPCGVRELGKSRMVKIEYAGFVVVTGNGLRVSEDLARRFVTATLDAQCEDPEQRPFKPGFLEQVDARRGELLADALTIWRWGRQNKVPAGIPLGSFETWGQWVRDPLLALGCRDPVSRIAEIKANDPARQKVIEVFGLWWAHHGATPVKATELHEEVKASLDPQGRGRQYLAKAVEDSAGTRAGGYVLSRQKGAGRWAVATYRLQEVCGESTRHRGHRGHDEYGDAPLTTPMTPMGRGIPAQTAVRAVVSPVSQRPQTVHFREVPEERRPALGPLGDSLDDLEM